MSRTYMFTFAIDDFFQVTFSVSVSLRALSISLVISSEILMGRILVSLSRGSHQLMVVMTNLMMSLLIMIFKCTRLHLLQKVEVH